MNQDPKILFLTFSLADCLDGVGA